MVEEMTTILHLLRGQLAEAIRTGESALALRERLGGHLFLSLNAALFLMIAHAIRGDYAAVEPLFDVLLLGTGQRGQPSVDLPIYLFYAGRVRWLQGRLEEACHVYDQMRALMEQDARREFPETRICRAWMRSLLQMEQAGSWSLAFWTHPQVWGQGYASEIAACALECAFRELAARRVWAAAARYNHASLHVLRKLGLSTLGENPAGYRINDRPIPTVEFSIDQVRFEEGEGE
jgi:GNAT superfamily N-acetyltransferase